MADKHNKGFNGLSDLGANIDEILNEEKLEREKKEKKEREKLKKKKEKEANRKSTGSQAEKKKPIKDPSSDGNSFLGIALLFGIFFLVLIAIGMQSNTKSTSASSTVSSTTATETYKKTDSSTKVDKARESKYIPPKKVDTYSCTESQPSSFSRVLDSNELCYCLSEKIRIDAAEKVYDRYSQSSINKFNKMVDNYNSKCNNKQYYQKAWDKVNTYVQSKKYDLKEEGKALFPNTSSYKTSSSSYFTCNEEKPSIYTTLLNPNQICYCLAEKIRLDAAQGAINRYSQSDINRYNSMSQEYNSLCSNKKYYQNDWNKANSDVNLRRYTLQQEGRNRFYKAPPVSTYQTPSYTSSTPKPKSTIRNKYSLTVNPTPSDARVQIMNIKPKYYDGIKLKKGKYHIKVSKKGYKTVEKWIKLIEDKHLTIKLINPVVNM